MVSLAWWLELATLTEEITAWSLKLSLNGFDMWTSSLRRQGNRDSVCKDADALLAQDTRVHKLTTLPPEEIVGGFFNSHREVQRTLDSLLVVVLVFGSRYVS